MKLTTRARYGLKICLVLGVNHGYGYLPISDIASRCGYSQKYTEKIMRHLKAANIVQSEKGVAGGYQLTAPPDRLSIGEILRALEDNLEFIDCVGGECAGSRCCPTHDVWRRLYEGINGLLNGIMLGDIVEDYKCAGGGRSDEQADIYGQCSNNKC